MLLKNNQSNLLSTKGKNRFTYYIPSSMLISKYLENTDNEENKDLTTKLSTLPTKLSALPTKLKSFTEVELKQLAQLKNKIDSLPKRINNKIELENIIISLCKIKAFKLNELAVILDKNEKYLYQGYIKDLLETKRLIYKFPDMINHPEQAYKTKE